MSIPTSEELGIIVARELGTHSNEEQRRVGRAVREAVLEGAAREAIARNGSEIYVGYPDQVGDIAFTILELDGFVIAEFLRSLKGVAR